MCTYSAQLAVSFGSFLAIELESENLCDSVATAVPSTDLLLEDLRCDAGLVRFQEFFGAPNIGSSSLLAIRLEDEWRVIVFF